MFAAQEAVELSFALDTPSVILRIVGAALLGGAIGLERELSEQPAGFRTHILVSMGAALFTLVGAYAINGGEGFDPTRVAAQVATGIGFIGAGVIFQQGASIKGLTTAASLWVTAAIGTAAAFGFWAAAIVTAAITLVSLYGLKQFQRAVLYRRRRQRQQEEDERG